MSGKCQGSYLRLLKQGPMKGVFERITIISVSLESEDDLESEDNLDSIVANCNDVAR